MAQCKFKKKEGKMFQIYIDFLYDLKPCCVMTAKIKMCQYVIFLKSQNFDTADILVIYSMM